jgi:PKD repeat protein
MTVQFTDASTGTITSRLWNFGDGATSTDRSPSHQYTAAGTYLVNLTVTGPGGSDYENKTGYITVKTPAQSIGDLITTINNLNIPNKGGFTASLDAALKSLNKGNTKTAINQLNAFINKVQAQRGKSLTNAQADAFIAQAQEIINHI